MEKFYKYLNKQGLFKLKEKLKRILLKIINSKVLKYEILAYRLFKPYFNYQLSRRESPPQYLFLLCPVRSGSTLLAHILSNHPKISGRFEHHEHYNSHHDLRKLVYRTAVLNNNFRVQAQSYFVDKLVWNYNIDQSILKDNNVKFIFLLRDPHENLNSMAKINPKWKNAEDALNYYKDRINELCKTASEINDKNRCLLTIYNDLVDDTENVLLKLKNFLKTEIPFTENYKTIKNTGNLKFGDPSSTIKSGKIDHNKKPVKDYFDEDIYEKANSIYTEGIKNLTNYCTS